jgi:hypothetical protein
VTKYRRALVTRLCTRACEIDLRKMATALPKVKKVPMPKKVPSPVYLNLDGRTEQSPCHGLARRELAWRTVPWAGFASTWTKLSEIHGRGCATGSASLIRREKFASSPAALARSLMCESFSNSANGRLVSILPSS